MGHLLRIRKGHEHARVTFVELFFDLAVAFAEKGAAQEISETHPA